MRRGVVCPSTNVRFKTLIRTVKARGFSKCDTCELLKAKILNAKSEDERSSYSQMLQHHYDMVGADRRELARIARCVALFITHTQSNSGTHLRTHPVHGRKCAVDKNHFGFFMDAVDSQKFGIPTTASQAKCLGKMARIKQKLTGVQLFDNDKLLLFRTLPDVKTGGNLTLTILSHMWQHYVRASSITDVYINFDGATDNMCYTVLYGLAHLLHCSNASGWTVKRIHVLRFQVGHTHNMLDGSFGIVSRHVYGKHGTTPVDILSFSGFDEVFGLLFTTSFACTCRHTRFHSQILFTNLTHSPADLPRSVRRPAARDH